MRLFVAPLSLLLIGCTLSACAAPQPTGTPATPLESAANAGAPPEASTERAADENAWNAWEDALEAQVEADARAGTTRKFASLNEARDFLMTLTPAGFRPRPEFFAKIPEPDALANRVARYAQSHPMQTRRRVDAFMTRLEPQFRAVSENIAQQFPSRPGGERVPASAFASWMTDAQKAVTEAKRTKKGTLLVFHASWCAACVDVDRTLVDASVKKDLRERVVAARVDASDDSDPTTAANTKQYNVVGLPTVIVLDRSGKEVARATESVSPARLREMLALAK